MFALFRTLTYATLFVGFLLIYLPARILAWSGIVRPEGFAWPQALGTLIACMGAAIALWCVGDFVCIGKGTPAPFDPPRRLVIRGPYRYMRNPTYMGAVMALAGAAVFYESAMIAVYCAAFLLVTHFVVALYEEPTLRGKFGQEYVAIAVACGAGCPRCDRCRVSDQVEDFC